MDNYDKENKKELYLIVNADDGFYSYSRDIGILRCFMSGVVNDVSVLMNGMIAKSLSFLPNHQRHGVSELYDYLIQHRIIPGIHINLTEGVPLNACDKVSSLLDKDGLLKGKLGFRGSLLKNQIKLSEVALEIQSQIDTFVQMFHCVPSHLDGHQHVHVLPEISQIICDLMKKYDIKITRIPRMDISLAEKFALSDFLQQVVRDAEQAAIIYRSNGIVFAGRFCGLSCMGHKLTNENLSFEMKNSYPPFSDENLEYWSSAVELMVHPGYSSCRYEPGGCGGIGQDSFSQSPERFWEMKFLMSVEFQNWFQNFFHKSSSFDKFVSICQCNDHS